MIGGGSPLRTARAFVTQEVVDRLAQEWGEAVWTARDMFETEASSAADSRALRFLFGL